MAFGFEAAVMMQVHLEGAVERKCVLLIVTS